MGNTTTYLVGGGLFFLVIVSGIWFIGEIQSKEDVDWVDETRLEAFNQTFGQIEEYNAQASQLENSVRELSATTGIFDFLVNLISAGWNVVRLLFDSFSILTEVISSTGESFGIPPFFTALIVSLIAIIFSMWLVAIIFNR